MPILRSAKKRLRQTEKKRAVNDRRRRAMRESIKEFEEKVNSKDKKAAEALVPNLYKKIDKATKAGIIKKGNASRKKSRLSKKISNLS